MSYPIHWKNRYVNFLKTLNDLTTKPILLLVTMGVGNLTLSLFL
ncbi:hypothetical protein MCHI_001783 [Candidatus Magnetoovum chiemensis]|nr:hypothetical protein MCHI_001783 [Candidatus Magnetoovum chiemensis]